MAGHRVVGKSQPRLDGPVKVTGKAQFTDDVLLPGMIFGKIVRSSIARGRIVNIDTSKAEKLAGVVAVITHKDTGIMNEAYHQLLRSDTVNYVGDEIAAVAALSEEIAAEAAELIRVEYEPLPAVFSLKEATAEGAPVIHEGQKNNFGHEFDVFFGDTDKAFAESDIIREGNEYTYAPTHNCYAEHHVAIVDFSTADRMSVWTPNQSPLATQDSMAHAFDLASSDVRVLSLFTGGAFSGRIGIRNHHLITALLSRKAGRPVKIRCTAAEEFIVNKGSGYHTLRIKTGVMKDGTLKAMAFQALYDSGAYMHPIFHHMPVVDLQLLTMCYRFEALRYAGGVVYTNTPPFALHHGGQVPEFKFGMEAELDHIARELGMDPVELRLRNAHEKGDITVCGLRYGSCGLKECIQKATEKTEWKKKYGKLPPYKGIGIGCGSFNAGGKGFYDHDNSAAFIKIEESGKPTLFTGLPELGQGGHTTMAMIAAEILGLPLDEITVVGGDTDSVPFDIGAFGQRGTTVTGNAVKIAALDAKQQLQQTAAKQLGVEPSAIIFQDRKVYPEGAPDKGMSFEELVRIHLRIQSEQGGGYVMGKGAYNKYHEGPFLSSAMSFSFGAQIAEVEVDPETGAVRLLKMTVADDLGFAINPIAVEGQIDGQVFSGMGRTLFEEIVIDKGLILNPSILNYRLARPFEVPEMGYILVETIDPYGPFGAKEIAEGPIVPPPAAIASAVSNAIGYPITELPITPERVLRALRQKENEQKASR